jgi:hypothetical protein
LFPEVCDLTVPDTKTALPSAYGIAIMGQAEHQRWALSELRLRVGLGHELIEELRRAIGLHSWLIGGKKKARGVKAMLRVSGTLKASARKRGDIIGDYIRNWARIARLNAAGFLPSRVYQTTLQGLQPLDSKTDIKFFQEWGNKTGNYVSDPTARVSWIWQVAMLRDARPSDAAGTQTDIKTMTRAWESEGSPNPIKLRCILIKGKQLGD